MAASYVVSVAGIAAWMILKQRLFYRPEFMDLEEQGQKNIQIQLRRNTIRLLWLALCLPFVLSWHTLFGLFWPWPYQEGWVLVGIAAAYFFLMGLASYASLRETTEQKS